MSAPTYSAQHVCEAADCSNLSPTSRTCSGACRSKLWKAEHEYRDYRRAVPNVAQRSRRPSRDGHGSKVYVNPQEAARWSEGIVPASLREKLDRAAERIHNP